MPSPVYIFHHEVGQTKSPGGELFAEWFEAAEKESAGGFETQFFALAREAGFHHLKTIETKSTAGVFRSELWDWGPEVSSGQYFCLTLSIGDFREYVGYISCLYAHFMQESGAEPKENWTEIIQGFDSEIRRKARLLFRQELALREDTAGSCSRSVLDYWDAAWQFWEMQEFSTQLLELSGSVTVWEA